jgi:hypothetical protein
MSARGVPLALLYASLITLVSSPCSAADGPQHSPVAPGERVAQMFCSGCHVVVRDPKVPSPLHQSAPAFAEIANWPSVDEKSLRTFLAVPHWDENTLPSLPTPRLSAEQNLAVSRYILSLRH